MKNLNFQYKVIISSSYCDEIAKQLNRLNILNYDYYLYSSPILKVIKGIEEKILILILLKCWKYLAEKENIIHFIIVIK